MATTRIARRWFRCRGCRNRVQAPIRWRDVDPNDACHECSSTTIREAVSDAKDLAAKEAA